MTNNFDFDETALHAFIDGEIDAERKRALEARLLVDPVLAARIEAFRADKAMLKEIYGPLIAQPVPAEWARMIRRDGRGHTSLWRLGAVAAAVLLVVGFGAAYLLPQWLAPRDVVQTALEVRAGAAPHQGMTEVDPGTDVAAIDAELSKEIALPLRVPDLQRIGYRLSGIRFYANAPEGRAAELRYVDGSGKLFTLYIRRSNGRAQFDQFKRDGLRICIWQDDTLSMVMAGNVTAEAMQRLASLSYTGLVF